jgi:hypothetical protein
LENKKLKKVHCEENSKMFSNENMKIHKRSLDHFKMNESHKNQSFDLKRKNKLNFNLQNEANVPKLFQKKPHCGLSSRDSLDINMKKYSKAKFERLSTNLEDFHIKNEMHFMNNNASNIEIYFLENEDKMRTTRNKIYTRSYYYDERSEMYKKVIDLSKIYSDCPGMYKNRSVYIHWIIKSVKMYELFKENQVISRTIQILDFLFCKCQMDMVQTEILTKVGITCIWIASKYEGVDLSLNQLLSQLEPALKKKFHMSKHAILACENMILKATDFRISSPVHTDFMENYFFRIFYNKNNARQEGRSFDRDSQQNTNQRSNKIKPNFEYQKNKNDEMKKKHEKDDKKIKDGKENSKKSKSDSSPISFDAFKNIIKNYKKNRVRRNKIKMQFQTMSQYQSNSFNSVLEKLMRDYTNYYLKILYHSMYSCEDTHIGTLSCIILAFQTLQKLPDQVFENVKTSFSDKCLFFIQNMKKPSQKFSLNKKKYFSNNPQTMMNSPSSNNEGSILSCTQSTKIRQSKDSSIYSSRDSVLLGEFSIQKKCSKKFKRKSHNLTSEIKMTPEQKSGHLNEYLLLQHTQKNANLDKVRFNKEDIQLFWINQSKSNRNRFLRYQCLNYLSKNILAISDSYPDEEIHNIKYAILRMEKKLFNHPEKYKFLIHEHPHPRFI